MGGGVEKPHSPARGKRPSPAQSITMKHSSGAMGKSSGGFHKASTAPLGHGCSCGRGGVLHALTDKTQLDKKYTRTKLRACVYVCVCVCIYVDMPLDQFEVISVGLVS